MSLHWGPRPPSEEKVLFISFSRFEVVFSEDKNVSHPDEEVDHEENIECQVDLLSGVLRPGDAGLNCVAKIK